MIYAIVVVLVLIADQAVKFWTTKNILLGALGEDCVPLIKGFVHMTNVHNTGAAFSILQNARWPLVIVTAVFVIAIIWLISSEVIHTRFGRWTAVLVLAGAIGNCIDRVLYGYVVDMFEFEFSLFGRPFSFPVFNVADIFITVAGILFCIHLIFHNEPEAVKAANEPEFMRRRREAREAKEAPYANIPKRGEHVSLEEELKAADPDDPFAEWSFGADVPAPEAEETPAEEAPAEPEAPAEEAPAEEPEPEPQAEPERPEPPRTPAYPDAEDLFASFGFEPGGSEEPEPAPFVPAPAPEPEPGPAPESAPEAAEPSAEEPPAEEPAKTVPETFSLEDILAEFSDF